MTMPEEWKQADEHKNKAADQARRRVGPAYIQSAHAHWAILGGLLVGFAAGLGTASANAPLWQVNVPFNWLLAIVGAGLAIAGTWRSYRL